MLRLKELRKVAKLNQQQLAKMVGVSQAAYSGWENEKFQIDNDSLCKLSEIFGVTIGYLLGQEDEPKTLDEQLEGVDFALYGEIHDLTDTEKQDILSYIKFKKSQRGDND